MPGGLPRLFAPVYYAGFIVEFDMSETLFKEVRYTLGGLVNEIGMGQIGLPDIQRPFVWSNAKVRDLFDSMYRGYPVGFFLFWETGAEGV